LIALTAATVPVGASSANEAPRATPAGMRRWVRSPIIISLSSSLSSPGANLKDGGSVVDAVRKALQSWTAVGDIKFFETFSTDELVSPEDQGDGINLITFSKANAPMFASSDAPARTRVFYDSGGSIVEADIALNPNVAFSTDGTPGTYDLESTLAHEIGHLLGLEHSAVISATMQPRQAKNGTYNLPAISQRTLSEADAAQARALYGSAGVSLIAGRVTTNVSGRVRSIVGAHFFAEDLATGRVVAGGVTSISGQYRVAGLLPGVYRVFAQPLDLILASDLLAPEARSSETAPPFRSFVATNSTPSQSVNVSANAVLKFGFFVFANGSALAPRLIGMNGELSTAPLPLRPGEKLTIHIAGEGVDDISIDGLSASSSLLHIVEDSLKPVEFDIGYPAISFDLIVDDRIKPGDYTIRLQSRSGESAYLPGAITIETR
jgi:hypothetical protein